MAFATEVLNIVALFATLIASRSILVTVLLSRSEVMKATTDTAEIKVINSTKETIILFTIEFIANRQ
ncbi:hypothetical protein JCM19233_6035 [Vibrio astriarenae]|nr:hypothetical protein JCM19233_6035 [Vibrio sp. C7]